MTRAAVLPACPKRDNCYINVESGEILQFTPKNIGLRFNLEVQHRCAKIARIFVLVKKSSKVF